MQIVELHINRVKIKDRFREDLGDIEGLAEAIKEKGVLQPITVAFNNKTRSYQLLAGGRRITAAKLAGLKKIPAVVREYVGEQDSLEIELMENIARKDLGWDELLRLEKRLHEFLKDKNPGSGIRDTAEEIGESKSKLARDLQLAEALELIPDLAKEKTKEEAFRRLKKITKEVTVQEMIKRGRFEGAEKHAGKHYKIGDALKGLQKVNPGVVSFCEVDPPYSIALGEIKSGSDDFHMDKYNEIPPEVYPIFCEAIAKECYRILQPNAFCVWWFGITHYHMVREVLRSVKFSVHDVPAIWNKGGTGQTRNPNITLAGSYETFFVARKGSPTLFSPGRSNAFNFAPVSPQRKIHSTEKPVELMDEILNTFAWPDALVCCPFLGSGVTLRAAYRRGLVGYGWDLDEDVKNSFLLAVEEDIRAGLIDTGKKGEKK